MAGTFDEYGLGDVHKPTTHGEEYSMVQLLIANGYKVELCDTCYGWGKIPFPDPFENKTTEEICTSCRGSGRKLAKMKVKLVPFVLPPTEHF